jgi:hypothetical protein
VGFVRQSEGAWGNGPASHSHLISLLIVGQDLGHVPVPGGDGLDVVIAAVRLKHRQDVRSEMLGPSFGPLSSYLQVLQGQGKVCPPACSSLGARLA